MTKIKLNFLHVCDYASFDQAGKLNILGIFENITPAKFPYQHPQFFIVANISIPKTGEYECVIRIVDPENTEISKFILPKVKLSIGKEQPNANIAVVGQFLQTKFENPGKFKVEVLVDGEVVDFKEINALSFSKKNA